MTVRDKTTLKGYFNTGDKPTESQFADLIDSSGGASSLADLTDVSIVDPSEGSVLAYNYTDDDEPVLKWQPKAVPPSLSIWLAEAPPSYHGNLDDEFDPESGFDGGRWTVLNVNSPEETNLSVVQFGLDISTHVVHTDLKAVLQQLDTPVTHARVITKISPKTNEGDCGIILAEDGVDNPESSGYVTFGWHLVSGVSSEFSITHWSDYETVSDVIGDPSTTVFACPMYLCAQYMSDGDTSSASFWYSYDGRTWAFVDKVDLPFVALQIGLYSKTIVLPIGTETHVGGITADDIKFAFFRGSCNPGLTFMNYPEPVGNYVNVVLSYP